jgi:phage tail sheath protein FI
MSSEDFLHGIDVVELVDGARPIRTAKSSVIMLFGSAGKGPVNTPTLVFNNREAVATFGVNRGDGFTIPAALKAIFDSGGATVVVVNVLDAAAVAMTTAHASTPVTFDGSKLQLPNGYVSNFTTTTAVRAPFTAETDGVVTIPAGATRTGIRNANDTADVALVDVHAGDKLIVLYTATLVAGVDYVLDAESGVLTRPSTGSKIMPNATIAAAYSFVDPTKVAGTDIIGNGVDAGIALAPAAQSAVAVTPRLLVAPGFTHLKPNAGTASPVGVALRDMAKKLKAIAILDAPNTTREDAVLFAQDFGADDRVFVHYPYYRILNPAGDGTIVAEPASARIAGMISAVDNLEGFWVSPSNHSVPGIVGLDKAIDFSLSDPNSVSNYLNMNWVATTIVQQGIRLWGNHTTDGSFLSGRRTADMVEESILMNHLWAVDKNITKTYVETVVEGVNAYLRRLKSQGAILGGKAWAEPELNTPEVIALGQLFIDFEFTRPTPAEHLTFRAHLVNDYVTEIFDTTTIG